MAETAVHWPRRLPSAVKSRIIAPPPPLPEIAELKASHADTPRFLRVVRVPSGKAAAVPARRDGSRRAFCAFCRYRRRAARPGPRGARQAAQLRPEHGGG